MSQRTGVAVIKVLATSTHAEVKRLESGVKKKVLWVCFEGYGNVDIGGNYRRLFFFEGECRRIRLGIN